MVALHLSFPYERAKEVAIRMAAEKDLDVEIGTAESAFGFAVAFRDIRVRTASRPRCDGCGGEAHPLRHRLREGLLFSLVAALVDEARSRSP